MEKCAVSTLSMWSSLICTKKWTCLLKVTAVVHAGQICCICQIHEERWEHSAVHQLFVDFIIAGMLERGDFV
jgi:hypothetical protein